MSEKIALEQIRQTKDLCLNCGAKLQNCEDSVTGKAVPNTWVCPNRCMA